MKKIITLFLIFFPILFFGQSKNISLNEAIQLAKKNSPDYKMNLNRNQGSYWRFKNYKASFLPQFKFIASLPQYSNSTQRITNDEGEDIFVSQNQSIVEGGLTISQNVPYTGGVLSINSQIEKINIYGNNSSSGYSVIPFSLSYYQNSIFYNEFKWDKKIEPLLYEESKKDFIEKMEDISLSTCVYYFSLLKAQTQYRIAQKNLSAQDTLFQIAKGRFKIGKIAENDLLQMELALLNSENKVTTNVINLKQASQNFVRYLELDTENLELKTPPNLATFNVDTEKALEEAQSNRKSVVEFQRKRLQAEQELARRS